MEIRKEARCIESLSRYMHLSPETVRVVGEEIYDRSLRIQKLAVLAEQEHDMLVTLATMAIRLQDLCGHDVIKTLKELGHGDIVREAQSLETNDQG